MRLALLVAVLAVVMFAIARTQRTEVSRDDTLVRLERVPAGDLGHRFERWRMIGAAGDTVTALWRAPPARSSSRVRATATPWIIVVLGGIGTDERAALLVPDSAPVGILAVSWPWKGPRRMTRPQFLVQIPAMRTALLRTPGALARGVEAVRRVTPGARIALVGASLGAPPTAVAIQWVHVDALVLIDGAADIEKLLRSETARVLGSGVVARGCARIVAPVAAWWLSPLEPARLASARSRVPTLLVDAEHEDRIPPACVARLHATFPQATVATHPGGHLRPGDGGQVAATVTTVGRWLAQVQVPGPGMGPPN
jgi:hypothetical protein